MSVSTIEDINLPQTIYSKDVIILKVNFDKVDIEVVQNVYNILEEVFPENKIIVLDKNIEIEVYRNAN